MLVSERWFKRFVIALIALANFVVGYSMGRQRAERENRPPVVDFKRLDDIQARVAALENPPCLRVMGTAHISIYATPGLGVAKVSKP
jgi:hypothetical protein